MANVNAERIAPTRRAAYEKARNARRRRGLRLVRATCGWCQKWFVYERQFGRPRRFCSTACANSFRAEVEKARRHYRGARVVSVCSPLVRCWVCSGDHCDGPALVRG